MAGRAEACSLRAFSGDDARQKALGQAAILASLENLRPFEKVRVREEQREVALHGIRLDTGAGALKAYYDQEQRWEHV